MEEKGLRTFGLVGRSLNHSFSRNFFNDLFRDQDIHAQYLNFELSTIEEIRSVINSGASGLNVTIPYKESVIPFLDRLSDEANAIGAVNCIQIINGKAIGHNTDAYGFHQSIKPFLTNRHERALILGTGGASKAIAYVLRKIGIDILFISRTPVRSNEFAYTDINEHMVKACKLIVNCTPVGTYPNFTERVVFPYAFLTNEHLVVDLIYNPSETPFLKLAAEYGAETLNGESMLRHQALRSWMIWNDQI